MKSQNTLPKEVQRLIDTAIDIIQAHPHHELGQTHRRKIYEALRLTPQGEVACKWLALSAAECVLPIYEQALANIEDYNQENSAGLTASQKPRHILGLMEKVLLGVKTLESIRNDCDNFYHFMHIGLDLRVPYLALSAAYEAMSEVIGIVPLSSRVSKEVRHDDGRIEIVNSAMFTDEELAGTGGNTSDAAVNAAYALAKTTKPNQFDYQIVHDFWKWWLKVAIPLAWNKAGETNTG